MREGTRTAGSAANVAVLKVLPAALPIWRFSVRPARMASMSCGRPQATGELCRQYKSARII